MALNLAFLLCPILAEAKPWYDILKKQHSNSIHKYSNINITTSPSKISELGTQNLWILSISEYLEATLHGSFWNLQLVLFYKHHLPLYVQRCPTGSYEIASYDDSFVYSQNNNNISNDCPTMSNVAMLIALFIANIIIIWSFKYFWPVFFLNVPCRATLLICQI